MLPSSNNRKRRQTDITTELSADINDPDDPTQTLNNAVSLRIANNAIEDFEEATGLQILEVLLEEEGDDGDDNLPIIIGSSVGGVALLLIIVGLLAAVVIVV